MNDGQRNKLSMFLAVLGVMESYHSQWQPITAIGGMVTRLGTLTQSVQTNSGIQGTPRTGITQGKNRKMVEMARLAAEMAGYLHAYAVQQQDDDLAAQSDVTLSDLLKMAEPLVGPRCQTIYDRANQLASSLSSFGLESADLTALNAANAAYQATVTAPRQATAVNTSVTAAIATDLRAGSDLLKGELDRVMRKFERTGPTFYQAYRDARIIVDLHGHKDEAPATPGPVTPTPPV